MSPWQWAHSLLSNGKLEDKLLSPSDIDWSLSRQLAPIRFDVPARSSKISFSNRQIKFPGKGALQHKKERGKALHFFANHELLAIEMMAQAILLFPEMTLEQIKILVQTMEEEQKHLALYLKRMKDFNVSLGDYPLNDFFWSSMKDIHTLESFFSVVSLTFEQANLDFATYYHQLFLDMEDEETANIMMVILNDEIKHVARGHREIKRTPVKDPEELWNLYTKSLPKPLTPARAKGIAFNRGAREKAGLSSHFINKVENYKNSFPVTERKQWKR